MMFIDPDVPPPGAEFVTLIRFTRPVAMLLAGRVTLNCVEETKVVATIAPFRFTFD
jgi:hypothetical protein